MAEGQATVLLQRLRTGDSDAAEQLFSLLYDELRLIASRVFGSGRADHTLQPTVLVHEAYLKMVRPDGEGAGWQDRIHFCNAAARAMRQVLINHARDRRAQKRGGSEPRGRVTLAGVAQLDSSDVVDALALHEAIEALAELDSRQAKLCELRFFGGLNLPESAEVLGVSQRTVEMDWKMAKGWLATKLGNDGR